MTALDFTKAENITGGSILSTMAVDIAINQDSKICILHDRPFSSPVRNLEFNDQTGELYFMGVDGSLRRFGMPVPVKSRERFARAHAAHFMLMGKTGVKEMKIIPVFHKKERASS